MPLLLVEGVLAAEGTAQSVGLCRSANVLSRGRTCHSGNSEPGKVVTVTP